MSDLSKGEAKLAEKKPVTGTVASFGSIDCKMELIVSLSGVGSLNLDP
jgi:hypothetical protein